MVENRSSNADQTYISPTVQQFAASILGLFGDAGDISPEIGTALAKVDRASFIEGYYDFIDGRWTWVVFDPAAPTIANLDKIYGNTSIVTDIDAEGAPVSSSTMPALMVTMLSKLGVTEGDRVLEIGTGTGYNAALLGQLVGPKGNVTSVDIDPALTTSAKRRIDHIGCNNVEIQTSDGVQSAELSSSFNRLIATVGCENIPHSWWEKLSRDGVAVVPFRAGSWYSVLRLTRGEAPSTWFGSVVGPAGFTPARGDTIANDSVFTLVDFTQRPEDVQSEPIYCGSASYIDLDFFLNAHNPQLIPVEVRTGDSWTARHRGLGIIDDNGEFAAVVNGSLISSKGADPNIIEMIRNNTMTWKQLGNPPSSEFDVTISPISSTAQSSRWDGQTLATYTPKSA
jgi:protein-L-isoaspartate(D-aspartate) O-methyltransferase